VGGSRATRVYGNASYDAGVKARRQLLAIAAEKLKANAEDLEVSNGSVVHRNSRKKSVLPKS
jgi:CO/xanthine dehydrogenase Mo-binding subunit